MAGLPTLHEPVQTGVPIGRETAFLAGLDESPSASDIPVTVDWDRRYYATKTGELLKTDKVLEGR